MNENDQSKTLDDDYDDLEEIVFRTPSFVCKYENNDVLDKKNQLYKQITTGFENLNDSLWAWFYRPVDGGDWIQFDCTDCLIIEYQYQAYTIS